MASGPARARRNPDPNGALLAALVTFTAIACVDRPPEEVPVPTSDGGSAEVAQGRPSDTPRCANNGTVIPLASASAARPLIAGRWRHCGGGEPSAFKDKPPFELTADGEWFQLRQESSGHWVPMRGFSQAGTYELTERTVGGGVRLSITFANNAHGSTYQTSVALSGSPRLLELGPDLMSPF